MKFNTKQELLDKLGTDVEEKTWEKLVNRLSDEVSGQIWKDHENRLLDTGRQVASKIGEALKKLLPL